MEHAPSIYRETVVLRHGQCDMGGLCRPSALLELMQDASEAHSGLCGLGSIELMKKGLGWIISRLKVEMQRLPHAGEKITIETFPTPVRHTFFPRSYVIYDEDGARIGCTNGLYALLEFETRHIIKSDWAIAQLPDVRDLQPATGMPATVRPLAGAVQTGTVVPQFTDLDLNVHVNNARYLDWCCNALGVDVMREHCLTHFDVNYETEVRPGHEVHTELTRVDNRFSFIGMEGDKRHFCIGGTLTRRE